MLLLLQDIVNNKHKSFLLDTLFCIMTIRKYRNIELKEGILWRLPIISEKSDNSVAFIKMTLPFAIGYSTKTVGRIERVDSTPSAEFMLRISKYFNMLVEDVFHVED